MEDCPFIAPPEAPEVHEASSSEWIRDTLLTTSRKVLSRPANSNTPEPQIADRTTEPSTIFNLIGTPYPIVQVPPMPDLGNTQGVPDCSLVDPSSEDSITGCTSAVSLLVQRE